MPKAFKKHFFSSAKSAFTLIELLVVIAIIGILLTIAFATFSRGSESSRDAKRKADIEALSKALELYRSGTQNSSFYPQCAGGTPPATCFLVVADNTTTPGLTPTFIKTIPEDPKRANPAYHRYVYAPTPSGCNQTTCTGFALRSCLESGQDQGPGTKPPGNISAGLPCPNRIFEITHP
jgi:prepilin-type N-terminal cleavage/methylation domain-containing protein